MIVSNNLAIHGWSPMASLMPANGTNSLPNSQFIGIDSTGQARHCYTTYIYDDVMCMLFYDIETTPGVEYDIIGNCAPVSSTVRLSDATKIDFDNFKNTIDSSIITSVEAEENGFFSFVSINAPSTNLVVWILVQPLELLTASLTCYAQGDSGGSGGNESDGGSSGGGTSGGGTSGGGTSGGTTATGTPPAGNVAYIPFSITLVSAGQACGFCNGRGKYNVYGDTYCSTCSGTGSVNGSVCQSCNGTGYEIRERDITCACCGGTGTYGYGVTNNGKGYNVTIYATIPPTATGCAVSKIAPGSAITFDTLIANKLAVGGTAFTANSNVQSTQAYQVTNFAVWTTTPYDNPSDGFKINSVSIVEVPCLSGDTIIMMADGTTKELQDIVVDDMVMSQFGTPVRVMHTARGMFNPYHILYHFEDGTTIDETHDHRFYNVEQGFWQRLKHWEIGDHAVNQNGEHVAFVSKERVEESAEMFGIFTEDGTYFANGLLSGAAHCNKKLLETATAEKTLDMILSIEEDKLIDFMGLDGVLV